MSNPFTPYEKLTAGWYFARPFLGVGAGYGKWCIVRVFGEPPFLDVANVVEAINTDQWYRGRPYRGPEYGAETRWYFGARIEVPEE